MSEQDRKRALALLEAHHTFPGDYSFSVIALNADAVTAAVRAAIGPSPDQPVGPDADQVRSSSGGKYLSHRITVEVGDADQVLDIYARLRSVEGVITVF